MIGGLKAFLQTISAWDLIRTLFPWSDRPAQAAPAIAGREGERAVMRLGSANLLNRLPSPLLVGGVLLYIAALVVSRSPQAPICFNGLLLAMPLLLLLPSLLLWALPLGLTLAPLVAREREGRTWEVLRATPYSAEEILVSKTQGALAGLRDGLHRVWHVQVQVLIALLVGGGAMLLLTGDVLPLQDGTATASQNMLCLAALLFAGLTGAAYVLDRAQQFVLMTVAALAAGATARSVRAASTAATAAVFGAWGADTLVGAALLLAQPYGEVSDAGFSLVVMALLGPLPAYLLELSPGMIAAAVAGTLVVRGVVIRGLWALTIRRVTDL